MKTTIKIIQEFLEEYGLTINSIDIRLNENGQVVYCTGTFKKSFKRVPLDKIGRDYNDTLPLVDKRFLSTELEITADNKFIITTL
jgi:hypothetical protein